MTLSTFHCAVCHRDWTVDWSAPGAVHPQRCERPGHNGPRHKQLPVDHPIEPVPAWMSPVHSVHKVRA